MNQKPALVYKNGVLKITGDLTFETVADLSEQLPDILNNIIETVDFQEVAHADSSAISFLLAIMRACKPQQPAVINLNHSLSILAKLYGVDHILFQ